MAATVNLPNTPYADGAVSNAANVEADIYTATATHPNFTLEVLNGRLENGNRVSGWDVTTQHIQRGAMSGGDSVGATANIDYFEQSVFGGWTLANDASQSQLYQPISGASRTFYLPYDTAFTFLTWHLFVSVVGAVTSAHTLLRLYVDGVQIGGQLMTLWGAGAVGSHDGGSYDRTWSGHHRVDEMAKGWHTVSIRTASALAQVRVRVRSLDYVYFR